MASAEAGRSSRRDLARASFRIWILLFTLGWLPILAALLEKIHICPGYAVAGQPI
jgi:hypothetical protein